MHVWFRRLNICSSWLIFFPGYLDLWKFHTKFNWFEYTANGYIHNTTGIHLLAVQKICTWTGAGLSHLSARTSDPGVLVVLQHPQYFLKWTRNKHLETPIGLGQNIVACCKKPLLVATPIFYTFPATDQSLLFLWLIFRGQSKTRLSRRGR